MSRSRKVRPNGMVLFITSSVKEGLPLVAGPLINGIIEGILARAQHKFGQEILGYLFMANHFHKMIRITNPETVGDFIGYLKCNITKAIKRLLGIDKLSMWCDRYDSPIVMKVEDVVDKLVYTYLNPVKAQLVGAVDEYPGLSSWNMFKKGKELKNVKWIQEKSLTKLKKLEMSYSEQLEELNRLRSINKTTHTLKIEPYKFFETFRELGNAKEEVYKKRIISQISEGETKYKRLRAGNPVVGAKKLVRQPIDKPYESKREGKKTVFICSDIDERIRRIRWYKEQSRLARDAWLKYRRSGFHDCYELPPGFFGPGGVFTAPLIGFLEMDI